VDRRVTVLGRCMCAFGQLWHLRVFYDRYIRSWLASVGAVGDPRLQRVDERNPTVASDQCSAAGFIAQLSVL